MDVQQCKKIFEHYGGMMRTKELEQEKIYYKNIQQLIEAGCVEKVRYGYYQWVNPNDFSEIGTVCRLFPDAILCMDTALRYYGYSDRTPGSWHLAVSKDSGISTQITGYIKIVLILMSDVLLTSYCIFDYTELGTYRSIFQEKGGQICRESIGNCIKRIHFIANL